MTTSEPTINLPLLIHLKEVVVSHKHAHGKNPVVHVLLAHKDHADAAAITSEIHRAHPLILITRTECKRHCLELMETFVPNVVIADYDFGVFPFINELREKNADIPFIIISELELLQNAPKQGLNIHLLKREVERIPKWLNTLEAAGMLNESSHERTAQIASIQKAVEPIHSLSATVFARHMSTLACSLPPQEITLPVGVKDPLTKWTEDLEKKMLEGTSELKSKPHRSDPLLPQYL